MPAPQEPAAPEAIGGSPVKLQDAIDKSIRKIYDRKRAEGLLDADLWEANTRAIWQSVQEGWKPIAKADYGSLEHVRLIQLRENVAVFNVFKMHESQQEVAKALFDDQGALRKWGAFKTEALKISEQYNKRYLKAEYQAAKSISRSASQWQKYDSEKEQLPYLTFKTVGDGRVRDSHELLDGVTYPIDDAFWNTYFPPIGWNCRCRVIQSSKAGKKAKDMPDVHKVFQNNPGKSGEIFTKDHPYFKNKTAVNNQLDSFLEKVGVPRSAQILQNIKGFNKLNRQQYSDIGTNSQTGGWHAIRNEADPRDLRLNARYAKDMTAMKPDNIIIRKHINTPGVKNPEALINGRIADFKTPDPKQYKTVAGPIKNLALNGVKQGCKHVVIHLERKYSQQQILKGIKDAFYYANREGIKMEVLDIKFRNESLVRIRPEDLKGDKFIKKLQDGYVAPK